MASYSGLGAIPLPSILDRWAANAGRSEGAKRKRPCHSRALSADPSCSSFRCAQPIKTITMAPAPEALPRRQSFSTSRLTAADLQLDRKTKASNATYEAAEAAGKAIKKDYPILQVAVYDGVESGNKIIELP